MSLTAESALPPASGINLRQFYQAFFDEADENLGSMEQLLLNLDPDSPGDETLNAIFRCAHSVKGGAAAFGFEGLTSLTHVMETLLDRLRRHELAVTGPMVDALLAAGDALQEMLQCVRDGKSDQMDVAELRSTLELLSQDSLLNPGKDAADKKILRDLELLVGPLAQASLTGDLLDLFKEVAGVGDMTLIPPAEGQGADFSRFRVRTTSCDGDLLDLCSFHVPREQISIQSWPTGSDAVEPEIEAVSTPVTTQVPGAEPQAATKAFSADTTIRVSVSKVDQLINLMGELVINQAMLAQSAAELHADARQELEGGLADLQRTTRNLQESVMAIRMIPMGDVFNRFPRMLRDLASKLGKQVVLKTVGEATELDKGLIEKITDPLTHLVRNSVDHGIETPQERLAAGKPAHGTLTLSARHAGGCILIEVRDDGRGLNRGKILDKARGSGLEISPDMSEQDIWQLIFAPGFSTAEAVTDVSGRGVGMDVVKRNILGLGGSVELETTPGKGTCVSVRLPLTLAIMDGMSVSVGGEVYLMPLSSVVESLQVDDAAVRSMAGTGQVVKVREEYLPLVALQDLFNARSDAELVDARMIVIVEAEGRKVALLVDSLLGQQQVVVKNLEANYGTVPNVSGATILGDGKVALILDIASLVRRARH